MGLMLCIRLLTFRGFLHRESNLSTDLIGQPAVLLCSLSYPLKQTNIKIAANELLIGEREGLSSLKTLH